VALPRARPPRHAIQTESLLVPRFLTPDDSISAVGELPCQGPIGINTPCHPQRVTCT
jgi:hypothetical protein